MTLRVVICIPTYNNPGTIAEVVRDALEMTALRVLLVDDGSQPAVAESLRAPVFVEALASGRLQILRFRENRGKGVALQAGFEWAIAKGYTHLLSVDGDGQHLIAESGKLLAAALENPWDLIIGKRAFATDNVPNVSKFGRKFSNFWVGFQTGHTISDSQSGYRLYPLFQLQSWKFWTRRFDFEIEILIRMLWHGVGVREVDIAVHYPPPEARVSHFDKLWDNVRISVLNTLLVILSLLKFNPRPLANGVALGLGVLIGCTPFFGFHTLIVAAVAFVFRLNAVLLFLGSQISIPPLAAILIPAEIFAGKAVWAWFGKEEVHFLAWLTGSGIFGVGLGFIAGVLGWMGSRTAQRRRPVGNWNGRTRGGRLGNGFLKLVLKNLGVRAGYFCLFFVVPYFYLFAPKARRSGHQYWRAVEPQAGFWRRRFLVMKQMYRFGQILMDRGVNTFSTHSNFRTNSNGFNKIVNFVERKQPLLMMTAHAGGWDIAASLLNAGGQLKTFHMVHYQFEGLTIEKVLGQGQANSHIQSLQSNQQPILQIKARLEKGEPVGLMVDRPTGGQYELVPFFGKLAAFDTRPFRIAVACNSLILFTFGFKATETVYDLYAFAPTTQPADSRLPRQEQILQWIKEYAETLEGMLRKYPEQWFNFFPFFSSRPLPPPGIPISQERHSLWREWPTPATPESGSAIAPRTNGEELSPR